MQQTTSLDRIFIKDLLVRGIVGIKPDERANRQDILVNATFWADTRTPGASDAIEDTVNYRSAAKAMIAHIESAKPNLVEKLAADLVYLCFESDPRIEALQEEQIGDLLDDFERIGNPAGPESVPDSVHLIADFAGEHAAIIATIYGAASPLAAKQ